MMLRRCFLIFCLSVLGLGRAYAQGPMIVNIDNPSFRKLVIAVPQFRLEQNSSSDTQKVAADAHQELNRLLNFTSMFNIMSETAYDDLMKKLYATLPFQGLDRGIEAVDPLQWKALGIESLTLGDIAMASGGYTIALSTFDTNRREVLLSRKFTKVRKNEVTRVIRRYADLMLQAYTGKPGIFSSRLVFTGRPTANSQKQIYISDFDGRNAKAITSEKVPHLSPSMSPDGRYVTYTSYEHGNPDLFIYDLQTERKRKLSGRKGLNSGAKWSPSGKLIAFTGSVEGDADIYTISPTGGDRKILIRGAGLDVDPIFSPDNKWMAFVSGRFGNPHIFRATLEWKSDSEVRVVEDKRLTYAGWYNAYPVFSPDSEKIVFAGYDKDIDRFDIFVMNNDGTKMERLTIRSGDNEGPSWSPNGQMVVFHSNRIKGSDRKAMGQLWVMNRDGGSQRQLDTGLYEAQTPFWGPAIPE
jgi:TolB protein